MLIGLPLGLDASIRAVRQASDRPFAVAALVLCCLEVAALVVFAVVSSPFSS
ncbi:MAG: hypothetical protein ABII12_08545 [Planctomycetota bacterium]